MNNVAKLADQARAFCRDLRSRRVLPAMVLSLAIPAASGSAGKVLSARLVPEEVKLWGAGAAQRVLGLGRFADGLERDVTQQSRFPISDSTRAKLREGGQVVAVADGEATLTAEVEGAKARANVQVAGSEQTRPFSQYLEMQSALAATGHRTDPNAKAQACILLWLEGGPSHVDTWDPKSNSNFKPISTNVDGIQISELLPRIAKNIDKLSIIRSMHTEEIDHPEGHHYALTGHRPNPAMQFPSIGSIIARETGPRKGLPPYVVCPRWPIHREYEDYFKAAFIGPQYDPMFVPDPSKGQFEVPDLTLPKSVPLERIENRRGLLDIVERRFRQKEERK